MGCGDLSSDATTGIIVPASISGITCPGANCTIKTFYDLTNSNTLCSAHCDLTQATVANRATLDANCVGSKPCATFNSSTSYGVLRDNGSLSQTYTYMMTYKRTSVSSQVWMYGASGNSQLQLGNSSGNIQIYAGTVLNGTATENAWQSASGIYNNTACNMYVEGSLSSGIPGTCGTQNDTVFSNIGLSLSGSSAVGNLWSAGMWPVGCSAGNASSMSSNEHTNCGC